MARNIKANALIAGWQNERAVAAIENTVIDREKRFLQNEMQAREPRIFC